MSSLVIAGDTSGQITLQAPAVSGSTTLTLPATSGTLLQSGTTVTVAQGGTGLTTAGTSGNVLTSDGTNWASSALPASGGMTLLGTVTASGVSSVSLSSLTLTSYKALFIGISGLVTPNAPVYVSSTNITSGGAVYGINAATWSGAVWIDLATGSLGGSTSNNNYATNGGNGSGGLTNVTTSSTIIYFATVSGNNYSATFKIYGVK